MRTIINNVPQCEYGKMWWGPLAKRLGAGFIDDAEYDGCLSYTTEETIRLVNSGKAKLLLYWRWPMPDMPQRQMVYNRQQYLLQQCDPKQTYALNGDHMMSEDDIERLILSGVTYATQELYSPHRLMMPYLPELEQPYVHRPNIALVYVGTPVQREAEAKHMLSKVSVDFYGSWKAVMRHIENHTCLGKIDNYEVLNKLSGRVSYIMAKPSYYEKHYVTPRWYEMGYASCAAIISPGYASLVEGTPLEQYVAYNAVDVEYLFNRLNGSESLHRQNVEDLREFGKRIGRLEPWYNLFGHHE